MISWLAKKLIGSRNDRLLRKMRPIVARINEYEQQLQSQPEESLREHTRRWQQQLRVFHPDLIPPRDEFERGPAEFLTAVVEAATAQLEGLAKAGVRLDGSLLATLRAARSRQDQLEALSAIREAILDIEDQLTRRTADALEEILPQAYAVVKNGARRLCGKSWSVMGHDQLWEMVHFDVQLLGGIALHRGSIAEMQTGEGKTLVSTLPTYLNALTGRGVHVVTVNDYLARRDSEWVGGLHRFLGLTVGCIGNQMPPAERRQQYLCDITYGTAAEFGFDYLRDNGTATSLDAQVQRGHYFAIVDEVDSILIDEARVPLIISGPATVSTHQFDRWKPLISDLTRKQTNLVNDLVTQARKKLEEGRDQEAGLLLWQAGCGMPRSRALLRMMEEPKARKARDQAELFLLQDPRKKQLFALQAELFFTTDDKRHEADLTDKGREELDPDNPDFFVLPDLADRFAQIDQDTGLDAAGRASARAEVEQQVDEASQRIHNINQLLKAFCLYEKDVHYVISPNQKGETGVVIVDQNTGREMPGRRWSDGLHQAVEAKEGVKIEGETQTYATITIQNYFRLYEKLAGMTGTAETESAEFHDIYGLDVLVVPTNRPNQRRDENDRVYKTKREKFKSVIERIKEAHESGQPVLVGTASVEASETLSRMLRGQKIPHSVLNAKQHLQEAEIVAQAGQRGAVTVSTNMAGRGTDIKLGDGVSALGGLLVLGTERHDSRRTDRQLRGRSARQGDPGRSVFYLSFEDDLMRNYGASDRMTKMMELFKIEEGQELQGSMLTRSIEVAQKTVEQRNYRSRKHILEYDDVLNQQRGVIYAQRNAVLRADDPFELLWETIDEEIARRASLSLPAEAAERNPQELLDWANDTFPLHLGEDEAGFVDGDAQAATEALSARVRATMAKRLEGISPERSGEIARGVQLNAIDRLWQEHLYNMDALKQGVFLRAKGQRDPLVEYKTEAYQLFSELMDNIGSEIAVNLFRSTQRMLDFERQLRLLSEQRARQQGQAQSPRPAINPSNIAVTGGAELWTLLAQQAAERARQAAANAPAPATEPSPPSEPADPAAQAEAPPAGPAEQTDPSDSKSLG